ncbi:MAG: deoxyhypusine synthase [Stygiobacter sp. RIFOXYC12_FULL_38_8]|nr:MAG: deoxyhypusine synthase [Stygiobacter sp. RIFOXYA12_FULL_38_9]OGV07550.1 MAG: deoxyhypusine synthase [Stygiobacter sp. RIFOXYB2_FULL_37_11]OGV10649.1 MAG: deoxyhypusine synthase [Stygiobacter sp. RIFOXYA2_FULL_38_8]OGV13811.1 MAG: deoxyhypusine synthase [Stygiobacter sp. RIFOXYC2_FULL_38_25]OGV24292.1 MAG: deoxyhypusine synthase [Stygiobacter sp. RIFOXYC12_FULL_38_8]OGV80195.1 MAG: deoxyhypusine synthase [Stygiobacter sp. GWF2_38_21]RJQ59401.1 MAG: deoxyhypusine synthase [Stygiobacter 
MATKQDYLKNVVKHIDIKEHNVIKLVDSMEAMAFTARDLNRAAKIYDMMLQDKDCAVILTLAGSLFSAGLKKVVFDLVNNNMVDAIVSTGAIMVDQDFFEALGFKHYIGTPFVDDNEMRDLHIDRIYDTFIDEDELRVCDDTTAKIFESLEKRAYSSRELLWHFGKYLDENGGPKVDDSVVYAAYKKNVPIFVPAFSDCSAGFGIVMHQVKNPDSHVSIDSGKDFLELTQVKLKSKETGIFMIGGGVPKNFTQDIVVAADLLQEDAPMHKYAVQITVADVRDGALSSSTLKEASSWGKVETTFEQMVYSEATLAMPLVAGYGYHKGNWKNRTPRELTKIYSK